MARARELVLVGGGHAHVQVLRRWSMAPPAGARLTVVVDDPVAVYSGMVPGLVAGQYAAHELEIDLRPLARRARARFVVAAATGIDADARRVRLAGRPALAWDVASLDVGSTVAGASLPGVAEHALATRPIGAFARRVEACLARARATGRMRVALVGAGAGGVELALAFAARLAREGVRHRSVTLLESGERALPAAPERVARRAEAALRARGVALRTGARVAAIGPEGGAPGTSEGDAPLQLRLAGGEALTCDAVVWVAGAAGPAWLARSGLPVDAAGFVRVGPTLEVVGCEDLFAAGDCARFEPDLPKAGVYAVRQGPVLDRNLRARLRAPSGSPDGGRGLERYRPQRDFLSLLNLGDGSALGAKWGVALEGRPLFALKDRIDRRFVRRFQVLAPDGARQPGFAAMPGEDAMACGGCAAKVGADPLARALERLGVPRDDAVVLGLGAADDAAAVETPGGELVVASVDAFRAFTDDPWLVGRVAAVNAASDLWAKGARPRFALAAVTVPEDDPERAEETLFQALAGARACFDAEGVTLVGGHSTVGADLAVGFAVWGDAPGVGDGAGPALPGAGGRRADALLRLGGLSPGDRLILTKPLGTGVLWAADMRGLARGPWIEAAVASMLRPNARAARVALALGASACTDVSGFGLAGHLGAMLRASKASARVALAAIPLLPGARECLGRGLRSTFHAENARARRALRVDADAAARPELDVLFDPQTSGGLLFGVAPERAERALARLREGGDVDAAVIGEARPPDPEAALFEVGAEP